MRLKFGRYGVGLGRETCEVYGRFEQWDWVFEVSKLMYDTCCMQSRTISTLHMIFIVSSQKTCEVDVIVKPSITQS